MSETKRDACLHPHAPRRGEAEYAEDLDARLGSYIKQAEQALMAAKSEALRPFNLTVAQYAVLMALYYVPDQSSAQLARTCAVTPQTMTTILRKLEGKRLVCRKPSKAHRKVFLIELTPEGEKLVLSADKRARAIENQLSDALSPTEHAQVRELLQRLSVILRSTHDGSTAH